MGNDGHSSAGKTDHESAYSHPTLGLTITNPPNTMKLHLQLLAFLFCGSLTILSAAEGAAVPQRPNILFCISDDQSYAHTGANGDPVVQTPGFDRITTALSRLQVGRSIRNPNQTSQNHD